MKAIQLWADGGLLGTRNPSPEGVYWSVFCDPPAEVVVRGRSTRYHTNNEAEWLAVRAALQYAQEHWQDHKILLRSDSLIVVNQANKRWRCKVAVLLRLRTECQALAKTFPVCRINWVPRSEMVDRLGH